LTHFPDLMEVGPKKTPVRLWVVRGEFEAIHVIVTERYTIDSLVSKRKKIKSGIEWHSVNQKSSKEWHSVAKSGIRVVDGMPLNATLWN
jgi:hypothetical protein